MAVRLVIPRRSGGPQPLWQCVILPQCNSLSYIPTLVTILLRFCAQSYHCALMYVLVFPCTCSSGRDGASQLGREAVRASCERRAPMAWLLVLGWASLPTP
jgi:hypothetical protein